jgi:hypothetical protein
VIKIPTMKCGHQGLGLHEGRRICPICFGLTPEAEIINDDEQKLEGRKASCLYCGKLVDSDSSLQFFVHTPSQREDQFYCGCLGWD